MSATVSSLRRRIQGVHDLEAVVRTMKAMAAANIGFFESAAHSLADYARTIELGLSVCLRHSPPPAPTSGKPCAIGALVFGSDQGMVGQFNDHLAEFVADNLGSSGRFTLWTVGERIQSRIEDDGFQIGRAYQNAGSITGISSLVGQIARDICNLGDIRQVDELLVFHNQPIGKPGYRPSVQRLLPLDQEWEHRLRGIAWPTRLLPETLGSVESTLEKLVQEHLFISLFRTCAESLAAENASRLAAMQQAEHNIGELLDRLTLECNRRRQSSIDEELFDVISGFEALADSEAGRQRRKE